MLPPFLASIIEWLRAGYPEGVPEQDYVPLFALLKRRLSDDEVDQVADASSTKAICRSARPTSLS